MAKKDKYNYSSPAAAGLGLAVTGAVSMIPGATQIAAPLGTMATGLFGGVDLTDEEMNIKRKFDEQDTYGAAQDRKHQPAVYPPCHPRKSCSRCRVRSKARPEHRGRTGTYRKAFFRSL